MKEFIYWYKDIKGKLIRGSCYAENFQELFKEVKSKGGFLLSYKVKVNRAIFIRKISLEASYLFCNQFRMTMNAGLNLVDALDILSFQCSNNQLKENLLFVKEEIKKGKTIYSSLNACVYKFPLFLCNMIKVAEESGKLDSALNQLSEYYCNEHKLKKKIQTAMFYPIIVLIVTFISVVVLLTTVIPSILSVLESFDAELPMITNIVVNSSNFIKKRFILIVALVCLQFAGVIFLSRKSEIRIKMVNFTTKIPVVGRIYKSILELKLSKSLAMLLCGGINILKALEELSLVNEKTFLGLKLDRIISDIKQGYSFSEAMVNSKFFSPLLLSLTKIGEETGSLEIMLEKAADIIFENLQNDMSKLIELIQPIMLMFAAAIIGTIVMSVMMPMFSISNSI